jgi:hypothetical protein
MVKVVFVSLITCLLILQSANSIVPALKKIFVPGCKVDFTEGEDPFSSPIEEDTSGEDDETFKLIPQHTPQVSGRSSSKPTYTNHFSTSFHFLEIISPPPQV